jgi:Zn-dependent M28 family amino/carboxypeptidase
MAVVVLSSALMTIITFLRVLFSFIGPEALLAGYQAVALPFLILLTAGVPVQLYTFLRVISEEPVLGANDNLSGVANCLALAEHLSRTEARPQRTTVWLVSFGCEEFGIRGSKRFIEEHREEIQDAFVLNLDMVGGKGGKLKVVTKEEKNLIRLSPKMVRLVEEVARKEGIPLKTGPIIAFTDAMAFAMKGIQATSLVAEGEKGVVDTYHSVEDKPEHLDYDLLFDSYRLSLAVLEQIDTVSE